MGQDTTLKNFPILENYLKLEHCVASLVADVFQGKIPEEKYREVLSVLQYCHFPTVVHQRARDRKVPSELLYDGFGMYSFLHSRFCAHLSRDPEKNDATCSSEAYRTAATIFGAGIARMEKNLATWEQLREEIEKETEVSAKTTPAAVRARELADSDPQEDDLLDDDFEDEDDPKIEQHVALDATARTDVDPGDCSSNATVAQPESSPKKEVVDEDYGLGEEPCGVCHRKVRLTMNTPIGSNGSFLHEECVS